jgi:hypothetical protein
MHSKKLAALLSFSTILFSTPAAFADDLNIVNYAEIEASLKNGIRILNSDKELIAQPTVKSVASPRAPARGLYRFTYFSYSITISS